MTSFRAIAQRRLKMTEGKDSSFNRGMATTLVQIAREWVNPTMQQNVGKVVAGTRNQRCLYLDHAIL